MDLEKFAHDFVRRLDAGEFDGRVIEVAEKLTREQQLVVHTLLQERQHRAIDSSPLVTSGYPGAAKSVGDAELPIQGSAVADS